MNKLNKIIYATLGVISIIVLLVSVYTSFNKPEKVIGSVAQGNECEATTTITSFFGATGITKQLRSGPGALCNVNVMSTGTGIITIYDATTSNALLRTNTATTTLAAIDTSKSVVSFQFDIVAHYGVLVETNNLAVGSTSISVR